MKYSKQKNKKKFKENIKQTKKTKKKVTIKNNDLNLNLKIFKNKDEIIRGAFSDTEFQKNYSCNYQEYINLLNDKYNYRKYYKNYESNQQIKSVVNLSIMYDSTFLSRLIDLILKRFNPKLLPLIIKILLLRENDTIIYKKLKNLYNSPQNKVRLLSSISCNKNKSLSQFLIGVLKRVKNNPEIHKDKSVKNYLDVGTGSGTFAIAFGNELNLDKEHIFGCDFINFSEIGDWNREKQFDKFTFKELEKDKKYPFEDNSMDVITMKMVLHHIDNIDFTFNEIKRILKKNGILIIIDHSAFTYVDYMLADIEHGLYINVYNKNNTSTKKINFIFPNDKSPTNSPLEGYKHITKKDEDKIESIDVVKYYDYPELDFVMSKYNLIFRATDIYTEHLYKDPSPTRTIYTFYEKVD